MPDLHMYDISLMRAETGEYLGQQGAVDTVDSFLAPLLNIGDVVVFPEHR